MLAIENLTCGYGDIIATESVSLAVRPGEVLGLIGANGAGKTTVIKAISGLVAPKAGRILVDGQDITNAPVHQRIDYGIGLAPEGRRIFPDLTVEDNLIVGATRCSTDILETGKRSAFDTFPRLKERRNQLAGSLSGGEQQMLAISRAMMSKPRVLLVDELSLGLMPIAIDECYRALDSLRDSGIAILLVEQNTERVADAADKVVIMETGRITWSGTGKEAKRDSTILRAYLGIVDV